jgi:hypothetical protein
VSKVASSFISCLAGCWLLLAASCWLLLLLAAGWLLLLVAGWQLAAAWLGLAWLGLVWLDLACFGLAWLATHTQNSKQKKNQRICSFCYHMFPSIRLGRNDSYAQHPSFSLPIHGSLSLSLSLSMALSLSLSHYVFLNM